LPDAANGSGGHSANRLGSVCGSGCSSAGGVGGGIRTAVGRIPQAETDRTDVASNQIRAARKKLLQLCVVRGIEPLLIVAAIGVILRDAAQRSGVGDELRRGLLQLCVVIGQVLLRAVQGRGLFSERGFGVVTVTPTDACPRAQSERRDQGGERGGDNPALHAHTTVPDQPASM